MAPAILISSSPVSSPHGSSPDQEATSMSSPTKCQCENQLVHWDWDGSPYPNLPEPCQRQAIENDASVASQVAGKDGSVLVTTTSTEDSDDYKKVTTRSDIDSGWREVITKRAKRARSNTPNESADEQDVAMKEHDLADNGACARGHEQEQEKSSGGATYKKRKYTTSIHIKISSANRSTSSTKISIKTGRKKVIVQSGKD
ncbi:hypothetical protein BYT27DRAFT_7262256 [Phlegmacium glaucopus]|nr:hypothetical protein BYT27DRAFT_7262256 [Phlegmacium glaucopus]